MSATLNQFLELLRTNGSNAVYHRDESLVACPCRTPEGYRDPMWHVANPDEDECNEAGFLPSSDSVEISVKAFVQPIQSTRATRLSTEQVEALFGEIQKDDHLAIFPCVWAGQGLNFDNWGTSAEDWISYRGLRFTVVNSNLLPDPETGNPYHHWELGLRLINQEVPV